MAMPAIRLHLDESVRRAVAVMLSAEGIDVTTTADAGLIGEMDEEQLKHAAKTGRVLVTHDIDFAALHAQNPGHAGIVYCHLPKYDVGEFGDLLILLFESYDADEVAGSIEFL